MAESRPPWMPIEAFHGALAGEEDAIVRIDVAGQQMRAVGVGASQNQRGHAQHIGCEARRHQLLDGFLRRHQDLAAKVPALLRRGQLIFKVDAGRARFDHRLHQLEGIEGAAESSFGVGDERHEPTACRSCLRSDGSGRRESRRC